MTSDEIAKTWVYYVEPAGNEQKQTLHICMTATDAVAVWKQAHPKWPYQTDGAALEDFCTVNFAVVIPDPTGAFKPWQTGPKNTSS